MCYPATKPTDSTALLQMMKSISSSNTPSQTNQPSALASEPVATPSGTQPPAPKSSSANGISTETPYTSAKMTSLHCEPINHIPNPYACKDLLNSRSQTYDLTAATQNPTHIAITKAMLDRLFPKQYPTHKP